jgi:hypothetical protein
MSERCEWNPVENLPSLDPPRATDCQNETWWTVGKGARNFHLCGECANLPAFYRFRKWEPINANPVLERQPNG